MNNEKLVEENKSLKEQINEEINKQIKLLEFEEYIFKLFTFLDKIF